MSIKIVRNDLFDYKNRYIYQFKEGFKFSLDSILLAEYVNVSDQNINILDMCTGNAPVPLILSLKTDNHIVGFEIQKEIADLAKKSVLYNNLDNQVTIINDSIYNIGNLYKSDFFDIITCNPPYFKDTNSNKNDMLSIARHEITINLQDVFKIAFQYLKNKGVLYIVHRVERLDDLIFYARENRLPVKEIQLIATKYNEAPNTVIVKCVKNGRSGVKLRKIVNVTNVKTYQNLFDRKE